MRPREARPARARTPALLAGALVLALAGARPAAAADLPSGFGGIDVGAKWADVQGKFPFRVLDETRTRWDGYASECGYRSVVVDADKGKLMLVVNDSVVTDVSLVTPIKEGSDLLEVADLVIHTYGQPDRASMRNALGRVTIDKDQVNFVTLEYRRRKPVEFTISGRGLWQYRIHVEDANLRWYENNMLRCARQKARAAEAEAAKAKKGQG